MDTPITNKRASLNETNVNDFLAGKKQRLVGYYDKWYRYNRKDGGAAYDAGVQAAIDSGLATDHCIIIECKLVRFRNY